MSTKAQKGSTGSSKASVRGTREGKARHPGPAHPQTRSSRAPGTQHVSSAWGSGPELPPAPGDDDDLRGVGSHFDGQESQGADADDDDLLGAGSQLDGRDTAGGGPV